MMRAALIVAGLALALAAPAHAAEPKSTPDVPTHDGWSSPVAVTGAVDGTTHTADVLVYLPKGYAARTPGQRFPLVLALHGWAHTPALYRDKGDLGRWADRYGLVVVVPAMGKTIYETRFYEQSKKTWGPIPGTRWVGEVVLPWARRALAVSSERRETAVVGYSTGGRGAVLLAEAYPEFAFAGSLSGTFDLMRLEPKEGEYKIHAVVYGPRPKFRDRWELDNIVSPARLAKLAGTTLFIAHGDSDKSVNPDQLDALRDALKGAPTPVTFTVAPGAIHDWSFWNSQSEAMFGALAKVVGAADRGP